MTQSPRDPVKEGWLPRGTPCDPTEDVARTCPACNRETTQDGFRIIMGRYGGLGAAFFVAPFLRRKSTKGKVGQRSDWTLCRGCGSLLPVDSVALGIAAEAGFPLGFLKDPA